MVCLVERFGAEPFSDGMSGRTMNRNPNNLALTWFQKVDQNITRRLTDHIVATENDRLRQYNAKGWCPVGEIFFPAELNSDAQLANGHIVFKAKPSAYLPAQRIDFHIELDLQPFFDELKGGG